MRKLRPLHLRKPTLAAIILPPLPTNTGTFLLPRFMKGTENSVDMGQFLWQRFEVESAESAFAMRLTIDEWDPRLATAPVVQVKAKLAA